MQVQSPGEGNGNPLQYSCLKNSMERGAWWATVHTVSKSQTWLSMHACIKKKNLNHQREIDITELCESFKMNHWISVPILSTHPVAFWLSDSWVIYRVRTTDLLMCQKFWLIFFPQFLLFSSSWWTIVLGVTKSWTQLNMHACSFLKHVNSVFWSMGVCTKTLDLISWESNWEITLGNNWE